MQETDDHELLAHYARNQSELAFAALVRRYVNLVYSTALRGVGNPHQAEEITQAVFIILARKASSISRDTILSGWLYQTARLTAANFLRTEHRRARREQEAYMQSRLDEPEPDEAWRQIAPLLEDAMGQLAEKDRNAVVLRFFDGRSLSEVGAVLGVSEDAAKMRVTRALEKLRKWFAKRGVELTTVMIAGAVSTNSIQAAPAGLAASVATAAVQGSAAATSTVALVKGVLKLMAWTKMKTSMVIVAGLLFAVGTVTTYVSFTPGQPREMVEEPPPPEPEYQGRTLSEWISANPPFKVVSHDDVVSYRRAALSAMGTSAVQYLQWMVAHPHQAFEEHSIGPRTRQLRKVTNASPSYVNFANAVVALQLLGPEARSAAPDLVRLWESSGNPLYGNYNGFPLALATLGNNAPEILAALHGHFRSHDRLHRSLCAFASWQLNPRDDQALELLRQELTSTDDQLHPRYALLETFWRYGGTNVTPLLPEIRNLVDTNITKPEYRSIAARAAWRVLKKPEPATALLQGLGATALKPEAAAEDVNRFAAEALDLAEIPGIRELAIPILSRLGHHKDASAAEFAENILERLKVLAKEGPSAPPFP
jgi:RNA polymerase sigma factor (sigma-70 family)